jgi:hypothetical protein
MAMKFRDGSGISPRAVASRGDEASVERVEGADGCFDTGANGGKRAARFNAAYTSAMKIKASDGRTYEVKQEGDPSSFRVELEREVVGSIRLDDDDTHVTLRGAKTTIDVLREVADEFIDRGGAPMRMM